MGRACYACQAVSSSLPVRFAVPGMLQGDVQHQISHPDSSWVPRCKLDALVYDINAGIDRAFKARLIEEFDAGHNSIYDTIVQKCYSFSWWVDLRRQRQCRVTMAFAVWHQPCTTTSKTAASTTQMLRRRSAIRLQALTVLWEPIPLCLPVHQWSGMPTARVRPFAPCCPVASHCSRH